jgi:ferredoxin-nitrite reductase
MNKIEILKLQKNPLEIVKEIPRFAAEGWESISEDDVQRLKWHGLFLRPATPGKFMLRVRIPGGRTDALQMKALAAIAARYGNGVIDLTTRMQAQLRDLRIEDVAAVFEAMAAAGLTSLQTGMDNVRNILGCPVAGLHPKELLDASPLTAALSRHIVGNAEFTNLPRKFNVAISACPDNCVHAETQDLALVPAKKNIGGSALPGFNVLIGGKLGSGGYRAASPLDVFVLPEDVVEVCSAIILLFRDHGNRELRTQNRISFLLEEWGVDKFRYEVVRKLKRSLLRDGEDQRRLLKQEHIGFYRQKQAGLNYVGLKVVVGRLRAEELARAAELAEAYGNGEIRISPHQALIIPNVHDRNLGALLEEPFLKTLSYNPSPVFRGLVSCVGSDYCHFAAIETKARAVEVARRLDEMIGKVDAITMHWSGCPSACGNHLVADIGLLGKRIKVGGEVTDAVDIFMGGRSGPHPQRAVKILENVPCARLPDVLANIIPYHTREKMHSLKGLKEEIKGMKKEKSDDLPQLASRSEMASVVSGV